MVLTTLITGCGTDDKLDKPRMHKSLLRRCLVIFKYTQRQSLVLAESLIYAKQTAEASSVPEEPIPLADPF